jgi:hypothetical protein
MYEKWVMAFLMSHEGAKLLKVVRRSRRHTKRSWDGQKEKVVVAPVRASPNLLPAFLVILGVALMSR